MRKILLNKNRSKESVNEMNSIPIQMDRNVSLFHDEIVTDTIDTFQIYNDEKNNSNKHRLIFTIYPICTNSLFNKLTEITYIDSSGNIGLLVGENGVDKPTNAKSAKSPVLRMDAIRNTEYSNDNIGFNYYCGADIFNNHLLRTKEDISVLKSTGGYSELFNTIYDTSRTFSGESIITKQPNSGSAYTYNNAVSINAPLYIHDTIKPFFEAYSDGIKRKDGWIGFYNPSTLKIPISTGETKDYYVNKCINNKEACQFIDMTPERDLFYFTPKKNEKQKRIEYNWDYYITYPSESVYRDGYILNGRHNGLPFSMFDGEKLIKEYESNNGVKLSMFRCPVRHNLNRGDKVKIKFKDANGKTSDIICSIVNTGDFNGKYLDRYFTVYKSDIENYITDNMLPYGFIKIYNGFESEYYFRKFKKITGLSSTINRLAFAGTIYGDEVSQIVFTDDIDVSNYKDNMGRPLSEIYLTIVKTNRGHEKWYNSDNNYNDSDIECSRIFGKVSSGLDLPNYCEKKYPTLRYQHNIDNSKLKITKEGNVTLKEPIIIANETSTKLEDDIKNTYDDFFGDLVEFNPVTMVETVLEDVMHRFNTAQRETSNAAYNTIFYDEILSDIYDYGGVNKTTGSTYTLNEGYANLAPEGYIYKPHYKIRIGKFSDELKQYSGLDIGNPSDIFITSTAITINNVNYEKITLFTPNNHYCLYNDRIILCDGAYENNREYRVETYKFVNNNRIGYECTAIREIKTTDDIMNKNKISAFRYTIKCDGSVPDYAYMVPDGSFNFLYKEIELPSDYSFTDELYEVPFTNGAFYHYTNINFPVRRQDPFDDFKMHPRYQGNGGETKLENNFEVPATEYDYSSYEHITENNNTSCF